MLSIHPHLICFTIPSLSTLTFILSGLWSIVFMLPSSTTRLGFGQYCVVNFVFLAAYWFWGRSFFAKFIWSFDSPSFLPRSLDIQSFWPEPPLDIVTGSIRGMSKACRGYCDEEDERVSCVVGRANWRVEGSSAGYVTYNVWLLG